jgi:hypothetical protein
LYVEDERAAASQAAEAIVEPADFEAAFRMHFAPVYRFIVRRVGAAVTAGGVGGSTASASSPARR